MFISSTSNTHTTAVDAQQAGAPRPQGRSFTRRLGAVAAAAAIAASLSMALPLESQAAPHSNEQGVSVHEANGQLPSSDATSDVTFVVTKGQKG